jgi:hypothetical protein
MVTLAPSSPVKDLADKIQGDHIVGFTASTGRSGTMYMAKMLALAKECYTSHEFLVKEIRQPINELFSDAKDRGIQLAERIWNDKSIPQLNAYSDKPYIESDARFLTVAYYFALRDIDHSRLRIINLYRDKARIALGNAKAGGYKKNVRGFKVNVHTLVYPLGWTNVTLLPKPFEEMTSIELAVWGVFETIERQRRFKTMFPDVKTFDWDMDRDSSSMGRWLELLHFLGLKITQKLVKAIDKNPIINSTFHRVGPNKHTLEEAQEAVDNHKVIFNPRQRPKGFL